MAMCSLHSAKAKRMLSTLPRFARSQKIVAADGMSINARNVTIITNEGKVTLRGPVASAEEKSAIERMAVEVAGPRHVTNQLEVAAE